MACNEVNEIKINMTIRNDGRKNPRCPVGGYE